MVLISKDNYTENISKTDKEDLELLNIQAKTQIFMIYAYVLEYISTLQGIEVIKLKYDKSNSNEKEPNPDITALTAAKLEIFCESVLAQISAIQYERFYEHYGNLQENEINSARFATYEIFLGNVVGIVSYLLNYWGIKSIYNIEHDTPIYGV